MPRRRRDSRIRVGTGGVLLPYYSPLKVAEVFRMLEALFPGRIDLGIGRAPGGDMKTAQAMTGGAYDGAERFPRAGAGPGRFPRPHAAAGASVRRRQGAARRALSSPQVWLLGSSDYSGALAAQLGLRFAFAHFISAPAATRSCAPTGSSYRPSTREPAAGVAAVRVRHLRDDHGRGRAARGDRSTCGGCTWRAASTRRCRRSQEAQAHAYSAAERTYIDQQRARLVHGDPGEVRDQLLALKEQYAADELMAITITGDYESRRQSYRLLAEAMG